MFHLSLSPPHLLHVTCGRMAAHFKFSNVIINGSTFNSAHGGLSINNSLRDPEFGMHDFMFVLKRILIDDPMKDFIP